MKCTDCVCSSDASETQWHHTTLCIAICVSVWSQHISKHQHPAVDKKVFMRQLTKVNWLCAYWLKDKVSLRWPLQTERCTLHHKKCVSLQEETNVFSLTHLSFPLVSSVTSFPVYTFTVTINQWSHVTVFFFSQNDPTINILSSLPADVNMQQWWRSSDQRHTILIHYRVQDGWV